MQFLTNQVRTIEHSRWYSADKIMSITAYSVNDTINKFGDFGCGYYFTKSYEQAERWAKRTGRCMEQYSLEGPVNAKCRVFDDINKEWIDFVMACRLSVKHDYDFVEGPVADDQIWNYVDDYLHGNISWKAFVELTRCIEKTNQIMLRGGDGKERIQDA